MRLPVATIAAAALVACATAPTGTDSGPQVILPVDSVVVEIFRSSPVVAAVHNSGAQAKYISRNPALATVDANGVIRGVSTGSTHVVATLADRPEVRDSVSVRVHADSCSGVRPDFGGMAPASERALFSYDASAPLNLQKTIASTINGVEVSNISFSSPDGGVVTGMMWDPVSRSSLRPGIVLLHGLPGTASAMSGFAQGYAGYGAVVIAIDAPFSRRAGSAFSYTDKDRGEQIQAIKDLQRTVDVFRSLPRVDANRIAFVGFSWGAATGALFAGIESRISGAALVVGHGGQVSHATGPEGHKLIANLSCAVRVAWVRSMSAVEPVRFIGHARILLLLQNGTSDEFIPAADAAELHAAAPEPKTVLWYPSGHTLGPQGVNDRHDWLVARIGIDPR